MRFNVMLSAQPHDLKRFAVIYVVPIHARLAAHDAWCSLKASLLYRERNRSTCAHSVHIEIISEIINSVKHK